MTRAAVYEGGVPALVLEVLQLDMGWLTKEGLMLDLPRPVSDVTVARALYRLRKHGLVRSRVRQINGSDGTDKVEWAAA